MTKQARNLVSFSIALFLPQLVGILSSVAAGNSVSTWYRSLKKPVWNPPGWIFAPVWTLLYGLMGLASWLVLKKREDQKDPARTGLKLYGVQLTLNSLWSLSVFGARRGPRKNTDADQELKEETDPSSPPLPHESDT
jgi:tryptophan-rich sensory protein